MRARFFAALAGGLLFATVIGACGKLAEDASPTTAAAIDAAEAGSPAPIPAAAPSDATTDPSPGIDSDVEEAALGERVATPYVSHQENPNITPLFLTLATTTQGAQIHYTMDGSMPSAATALYTEPLTICGSPILKAIALKEGLLPSAVFTLALCCWDCPAPQVRDPIFTPEAGTYDRGQDIVISCPDSNAVIFYTLDGESPRVTSPRYIAPIHIESTTVVTAVAAFPGFTNSKEVRASYSITDGGP